MAKSTATGSAQTTAEPAESAAARIERRQVDKFAERRAELAAAALATLSELGYARTSLREIAQKSGFSHGVLHYYFRDKVDLITFCVREYKAVCVDRYDQIAATGTSAEQIRTSLATALAASVRDDAGMHRLWYDLRNQSFFETDFRDVVADIDHSLEEMIWRIVTAFADFSCDEIVLSKSMTYGMLDGLFQQALVGSAFGSDRAIAQLQENVYLLLPRLLRGYGSDPAAD